MAESNVPVLAVRDLKKHFPVKKGLLRRTVGQVYAVDGISFASERCHVEMPPLEMKMPAHLAACFHSDRVTR